MNLWSQYANWKNCQIITNNSNMERTTYRIPTHPGDVVKEELEERGISQKEFASRTGISYTMLNEILNSKRPITRESEGQVPLTQYTTSSMLLTLRP